MNSNGSIGSLAKAGGEFVETYVGDIGVATDRLLDRLIGNVATLVSAVIEDGARIVTTAVDAFLPDLDGE